MKLLPERPQRRRVNTEDSLGHGMDAVIMLVIFLGIGFGLDRLFGTTPVFMIVMTVIGAVGLFAKFKYRYDDRWTSTKRNVAALAGRPEPVGMSDRSSSPDADLDPLRRPGPRSRRVERHDQAGAARRPAS